MPAHTGHRSGGGRQPNRGQNTQKGGRNRASKAEASTISNQATKVAAHKAKEVASRHARPVETDLIIDPTIAHLQFSCVGKDPKSMATTFPNLDAVAEALNREPEAIVEFFAEALGTNHYIKYANVTEEVKGGKVGEKCRKAMPKYFLGGEFERATLQFALDQYVVRIQCPICFGFETQFDEECEEVVCEDCDAPLTTATTQKPAAKSIVTMDVKPWDNETDVDELVTNVRAIEMDGLVWGGHKLVAVGYGIEKLQINLVVEDDKVSVDDLQAKIEEDEDHVQSTDVVAMQKH
ncbi:Elongation factor 1-beta [Cyphellophora attinorum]|uniref:Elongation factor 1-beta n=1 Tax=Cyphellophora attinorum TaxID=1664694 RepID=A0A0N1H464_9EURO|nr:Elongation factor 1-beta [Phialophora attinorum]KPI35404.1 Elongation factor 1-beta [Phialophora attinorum]